jgi:hypothetical protein
MTSKTIDTLVPDIYALLADDHDATEGGVLGAADYLDQMGHHMVRALSSREHGRDGSKLYASEYGDQCPRRVWYKVHHPELGEKLEPHTRFKFLYGDILESAVLMLAKQAGHEVSHEQERIEILDSNGGRLTGRTDALIDGHMVDVKSMSTYAFNKYKADGGVTADNDSFGYRWQIAAYHHYYDCKKEPYFLGIDKQNGHIALFPVVDLPTAPQVNNKLAEMHKHVYESEGVPPRGYTPVPEGKSGNLKLDIACSYCAFKADCWPGMRTFISSRGPVFLTHVEREPRMTEAA